MAELGGHLGCEVVGVAGGGEELGDFGEVGEEGGLYQEQRGGKFSQQGGVVVGEGRKGGVEGAGVGKWCGRRRSGFEVSSGNVFCALVVWGGCLSGVRLDREEVWVDGIVAENSTVFHFIQVLRLIFLIRVIFGHCYLLVSV